ncbi:MAG: hypothetical protein K2W93_03660 [Burkholderiaceae bacterium]|nr:hypothetical protein [Burkholderiaceae bacterium]
MLIRSALQNCLATVLVAAAAHAQAQSGAPVYRCPGPPVLYTDALSAKEAAAQGCRTIEGTPITVMQTSKPRPASSGSAAAPSAASAGSEAQRVEPGQQRSRDGERRRVLETELREAEERLAAAQRELASNSERRGDERNYQRYLDRMLELKANVSRQESDVQALKREISKLP